MPVPPPVMRTVLPVTSKRWLIERDEEEEAVEEGGMTLVAVIAVAAAVVGAPVFS
jgi:hypothetical protein